MIAQDRYNRIIETVEEIVRSRSRTVWEPPIDTAKASDKAFEAADSAYFNSRSRNEIFKFMTGKTFAQYLSERSVMHAYEALLEQEEYNEDELLNITGFSSGPALYKKFKETLGISPKEAFEKKDLNYYKEPEYWDALTNEKQIIFTQQTEVVRQVVKVDRKPYLFVAAGIILLILISFLYQSQKNLSLWEGEYVGFYTTTHEDGYPIAKQIYGSTYSIDPGQKRITIKEGDQEARTIPISLNRTEIFWKDRGTGYQGTLYNDGSIICTIGGQESEQLRLVSAEDLDKWSKQWDGFYDIYLESDGFYTQNGLNANVQTGLLFFILSSMYDETGNMDAGSVTIGNILYFGPDHLIYFFREDPSVVYQCTLTGTDTFEIEDLSDGHVLAKCFRIYQ